MLKNFRTYQASVRFYRLATAIKLPRHLKDQLLRAASSVALNLAEGYGKDSFSDKRKFYFQAFGSLRECQAVLDLAQIGEPSLASLADEIGGGLYKLCHWTP